MPQEESIITNGWFWRVSRIGCRNFNQQQMELALRASGEFLDVHMPKTLLSLLLVLCFPVGYLPGSQSARERVTLGLKWNLPPGPFSAITVYLLGRPSSNRRAEGRAAGSRAHP